MKKLLRLGFFLCLGGSVGAAILNIPANPSISVLTLTQVAQSTPTYVGQAVVCSNCGSVNGSLGTLCISTETTNAGNAYIIVGSSLTATTACQ